MLEAGLKIQIMKNNLKRFFQFFMIILSRCFSAFYQHPKSSWIVIVLFVVLLAVTVPKDGQNFLLEILRIIFK